MKSKKVKAVNLSEQDTKLLSCFIDTPSDLVFWSFRYFLGRMTIATCCFAEDLAKGWKYLSPRVQDIIKSELEKEFERDDAARKDMLENEKSIYKNFLPLGHDCDRAAWQKVREAYQSTNKD